MELDDFKLAWKELDRKLDRQYALDLLRFREERGKRMKSGLRPLVWGQALQMLFGIPLVAGLPRNAVGKIDKVALRRAWPQLSGA